MLTATKPIEQATEVKWYDIPFPATAYTFPEADLLDQVELDEESIHLRFTDGRILSIPLWWIPTVYHAAPEDRAKFEISRDRKMIIWDPEHGAINDELHVQDYLTSRTGRNG